MSQEEGRVAPPARLVPFAAYTGRLAVGFAGVALIVVPERVVLWSLGDADDRGSAGVLVAQLVALPVVASVVALVAGSLRDRKRASIYEGLPEVTPLDDEEVVGPDEVRRLAHRTSLWVLGLWFVIGLALPLMAPSIVALASYAAIGARVERHAAARDGRELLCRPRWFVWLPVAWRTVGDDASAGDRHG